VNATNPHRRLPNQALVRLALLSLAVSNLNPLLPVEVTNRSIFSRPRNKLHRVREEQVVLEQRVQERVQAQAQVQVQVQVRALGRELEGREQEDSISTSSATIHSSSSFAKWSSSNRRCWNQSFNKSVQATLSSRR